MAEEVDVMRASASILRKAFISANRHRLSTCIVKQRVHRPLQPCPVKPARATTRYIAQALEAGLSPLQAHIVAGRLTDFAGNLERILNPALRYIDHPELLQDSGKAASRIAHALSEGERIGIVTDYDVDGVTSHALIQRALTVYFHYPANRIDSFIGHRVNDGYGVSKKLTERILAQPERPAVIITADCGSSDMEAPSESFATGRH
ncbi:MAG: hypothetical protein R3F37_02635 [Candidatus Competibacteraceae bacterium]